MVLGGEGECGTGDARTSHTTGFPMSHPMSYGWVGWHPGSWMLCPFYYDMSYWGSWIYSAFSPLPVPVFRRSFYLQMLPLGLALCLKGMCVDGHDVRELGPSAALSCLHSQLVSWAFYMYMFSFLLTASSQFLHLAGTNR